MTTPTPSAHSGEQGKPSDAVAQIADALDCFWNAALGATHSYSDVTANAVMAGMVQGFAAVSARLRELERKHEQSEPEADDYREVMSKLSGPLRSIWAVMGPRVPRHWDCGGAAFEWGEALRILRDAANNAPPPSDQAGIAHVRSDAHSEGCAISDAREELLTVIAEIRAHCDPESCDEVSVGECLSWASRISAALQSAFCVGSGLATDENLSLVIDWSNDAAKALRELMAAYERRVRSSCETPEDLAKKPWECAEFVGARDVLDRKPNWFVNIPAHRAPEAQAEVVGYRYEDRGGIRGVFLLTSFAEKAHELGRPGSVQPLYLRPQPSASETPSSNATELLDASATLVDRGSTESVLTGWRRLLPESTHADLDEISSGLARLGAAIAAQRKEGE